VRVTDGEGRQTNSETHRHTRGRCAYHEREGNGRGLDALDHPHGDEADELDEGEEVDSPHFAVAQVDVVRLVLDRHQDDQ